MGYAASVLVVIFYRGVGAPPWLQQAVDLLVISAPTVIAVIAAVAIAGARGVWRRLMAVQWTDLVIGLGLGLLLRALIEVIDPTLGSLLGGFGDTSVAAIVVLAVGAAFITPVVEELYFRGLVVAAMTDAGRRLGRVGAGVLAVFISTAAFVALHMMAAPGPPTWAAAMGPAIVGIGCGALFVLTGRLPGAIAAHVAYNAIGVALLIW